MSVDDEELTRRLRQQASRHAAPDALRAGIRAQVALAEAGRTAAAGAPVRRPRRAWWLGGAAGFALGMAFTLGVLPMLPSLGEPTQALLVREHVRALRTGPLTEVASSDRHTVKPWFQGRLDYAPPVFDLAADGLPLAGGRIERVHGGAVAALAYTSRRHVIDLYVLPRAGPAAPERFVQRGFNVLRWSDGAMDFWAVSDVERGELDRFMRAWQARAAAP